MFITPSFKKSLIVEQFQGNYLKLKQLDYWLSISKCDSWLAIEISSSRSNCLVEMTKWSFPHYGRVFYSHPSFWKKPLMVMCLMSDDFNVFKIHVMMTFVNTARKFEVMIEHQDSLFVLDDPRLKWSLQSIQNCNDYNWLCTLLQTKDSWFHLAVLVVEKRPSVVLCGLRETCKLCCLSKRTVLSETQWT